MKKNIFCAAMWLLALAAFSFTLTSCGDDDKDKKDNKNNYFAINGEKFNILSAGYYSETLESGGTGIALAFTGYIYNFGQTVSGYYHQLDDPYFIVNLFLKDTGTTIDLTQPNLIPGEWTTGLSTYRSWYWTDDDAFAEGTLYVAVNDGKIVAKAEGTTGDGTTFTLNYNGVPQESKYDFDHSYTKVEGKPAAFKAKNNK